MMHSIDPEDLIKQAQAEGIDLDSIAPKIFPNSGIGIVATKDIDEGHQLISVPIATLRSEYTVPKKLRQSLDGISVHGLLAVDFILDDSSARQAWKKTLPSRRSLSQGVPYWWRSKVQKLLPDEAAGLLARQKEKISRDWNIVSNRYSKLTKAEFEYFWFLVNSRTFYYTDAASEGTKDPNDCLALIPFADFFNHSSTGCRVMFSAEGYNFIARHKISKGDEVFISYGAHSNDLLLAEYGFILEDNENDTIPLDPVLTSLFDDERKAILKSSNFWADYVLDANGICYRTEVAVRLLCMPQQLWLSTLEHGFDENDDYREKVADTIRKCLKRYTVLAKKRLDQIDGLDPKFAIQRDVLKMRWEQILRLLFNALAAQSIGM